MADIKQIMDFLTDERFVTGYGEIYTLTFIGRKFIESGGYRWQRIKELTSTFFQLATTLAIAAGAIATTYYYLHQLKCHP